MLEHLTCKSLNFICSVLLVTSYFYINFRRTVVTLSGFQLAPTSTLSVIAMIHSVSVPPSSWSPRWRRVGVALRLPKATPSGWSTALWIWSLLTTIRESSGRGWTTPWRWGKLSACTCTCKHLTTTYQISRMHHDTQYHGSYLRLGSQVHIVKQLLMPAQAIKKLDVICLCTMYAAKIIKALEFMLGGLLCGQGSCFACWNSNLSDYSFFSRLWPSWLMARWQVV